MCDLNLSLLSTPEAELKVAGEKVGRLRIFLTANLLTF
jgi:hypothetical protein